MVSNTIRRGGVLAAGAASVAALLPAGAVGAQDVQEGDAEVIAARAAAALGAQPFEANGPGDVQPDAGGVVAAGVSASKSLRGKSTANGYVEVAANDYVRNDNPGWVTTTMRVWGNAAAWRSGNGGIDLTSQFTCTGAGISGLSIGSSGGSVSGGATSSTLTWTSRRTNTSEVRQWYTDDGHFRCKASNLSPAKTTRRGIGVAEYKTTDTRAQAEYSFWW